MTDLVIQPLQRPLSGVISAPPDPAALEIALLLCALAVRPGEISEIAAKGAPSIGMDHALGVLGHRGIRADGEGWSIEAAPLVDPSGGIVFTRIEALVAAVSALCGLASGVMVTGPKTDRAYRVMSLVAAAVRRRGANVEGKLDPTRVDLLRPPYVVSAAPAPLSPLQVTPAEPLVKLAALISGVFAAGETVIAEPFVRYDATERMLAAMGAPLSLAGPIVQLESGCAGELEPLCGDAPGDPAGTAALMSAGALIEGSVVGVRGAPLIRAGLADAMRTAGGRISSQTRGDRLGVASGEITVAGGCTRRLIIGAEQAHRIRVPLPLLAILAIRHGGAIEAGVDPTATVEMLTAFQIAAEPNDDALMIEPSAVCATDFAAGDATTAMASSVIALAADGPSRIRGADRIMEVFPRFVGSLRALGAEIEVESS